MFGKTPGKTPKKALGKAPRKTLIAAATIAAGLVGAAEASAHSPARTAYVDARVVDVRPIVRRVTVERPRQECWDEVVEVREPARPYGVAGPTLAGGIIGAAIGRQFGSGDGRDALTVLGAVAGSAVAHDRAVRNAGDRSIRVREETVQRCRTVTERHVEERTEAYDVTYEYAGRRYHMRTSERPANRVRVRVSVDPVGYYRYR
jgi:uncharacterized protein YcfJ